MSNTYLEKIESFTHKEPDTYSPEQVKDFKHYNRMRYSAILPVVVSVAGFGPLTEGSSWKPMAVGLGMILGGGIAANHILNHYTKKALDVAEHPAVKGKSYRVHTAWGKDLESSLGEILKTSKI